MEVGLHIVVGVVGLLFGLTAMAILISGSDGD